MSGKPIKYQEYKVVINTSILNPPEISKIIHSGTNLNLAKDIFDETLPGYDQYGEVNKRFIVLLIGFHADGKYDLLRYKVKRL